MTTPHLPSHAPPPHSHATVHDGLRARPRRQQGVQHQGRHRRRAQHHGLAVRSRPARAPGEELARVGPPSARLHRARPARQPRGQGGHDDGRVRGFQAGHGGVIAAGLVLFAVVRPGDGVRVGGRGDAQDLGWWRGREWAGWRRMVWRGEGSCAPVHGAQLRCPMRRDKKNGLLACEAHPHSHTCITPLPALDGIAPVWR